MEAAAGAQLAGGAKGCGGGEPSGTPVHLRLDYVTDAQTAVLLAWQRFTVVVALALVVWMSYVKFDEASASFGAWGSAAKGAMLCTHTAPVPCNTGPSLPATLACARDCQLDGGVRLAHAAAARQRVVGQARVPQLARWLLLDGYAEAHDAGRRPVHRPATRERHHIPGGQRALADASVQLVYPGGWVGGWWRAQLASRSAGVGGGAGVLS